ncbi:MAG: ThiF family adenylyltransferase [Pseudomonadota bacterium]
MDLGRYTKQMLFKEIGLKGQRKISNSTVCLVGIGATGSSIASNLVRAGIKKLIIIDRDYVELDNLARQNLFDEEDIAKNLPKAIAATEKLKKINSGVEIVNFVSDLNYKNIDSMVKDVDLIFDGTDNFYTRFLINDFSIKNQIPWIHTGVLGSHGQCFGIIPQKTACFSCLIEDLPDPGSLDTCDTAGILGVTVNALASFSTLIGLKILLGKYRQQEIITMDLWNNTFDKIIFDKNPNCLTCKEQDFRYLNGHGSLDGICLCGRNAVHINGRGSIDLAKINKSLSQIHKAQINEYMLRFLTEKYDITIFSDGRAIIKGTSDLELAKSIYTKYIAL